MRKAEIRVLFIEDNPGDVDLFRELLSEVRDPSFTIEHFPTLKEGLNRVKQGGIDVVLLDLALPDSFGFQTFLSAHESAPEIPIVVLTVSDDVEMALAAMRKGAQDYLVKGHADSELLGRVIKYSIERKRAEEDQRFLAQAGVELAGSLDYRKTLASVAQLIVPRLADCCIIDLMDPQGPVEQVAVAHVSCEKEELMKALLPKMPLEPELRHGVIHVLRTEQSEIYPDLSDVSWVAEKLGAEYPQRLRQVDARSYMCVPLKVRESVFGAITFLITQPDRRYTAAELYLAEELAQRAALAVDNARLFQNAQQALRSRDDMLAFVSHDLKNPLNSIGMNAQLIQKGKVVPEKSDYIKAKAQSIQRSVGRMSQLISTLLDLSKIESGRLLADMAEYSIKPIIDEAIEMFGPLALSKGIRLSVDPYDETLILSCDRERILQVFSNLIGNAINHTQQGGSIALSVKPSDEDIRFSVKDTGVGISEQQLPHIFERYWQGQAAPKSGTGLGLYITKGIVASHGGTIWVKSEPGKGAEFSFSLPKTELVRAPGHGGRRAASQQ